MTRYQNMRSRSWRREPGDRPARGHGGTRLRVVHLDRASRGWLAAMRELFGGAR